MISPKLDGSLIFVDVDTQRDFLEPSGALFIEGSQAILANLARLTAFARERAIPVIATACAHTSGSSELEIFPPHCLLGTTGHERIDATAWPEGMVLGGEETLHPTADLPGHLTLHKDWFDIFRRADAEKVFARYGKAGSTFVVYGVATDFCVKALVDGLIERGYPTVLVVDAVRAVNPDVEPAILTEFARRGVLLTLTEVILGLTPHQD